MSAAEATAERPLYQSEVDGYDVHITQEADRRQITIAVYQGGALLGTYPAGLPGYPDPRPYLVDFARAAIAAILPVDPARTRALTNDWLAPPPTTDPPARRPRAKAGGGGTTPPPTPPAAPGTGEPGEDAAAGKAE